MVIGDGFLDDIRTVGVSIVGWYKRGGEDTLFVVVVSGIDDVCTDSCLCGTLAVDGAFVEVVVVVPGVGDEWFSSDEDSSTIFFFLHMQQNILNRNWLGRKGCSQLHFSNG